MTEEESKAMHRNEHGSPVVNMHIWGADIHPPQKGYTKKDSFTYYYEDGSSTEVIITQPSLADEGLENQSKVIQ